MKNKGKTVGNGNLKPFKPGQSGNLNGRPKGVKNGLRSRIMQALDKQVTPNLLAYLKQEGISLESNENAEALSRVVINQALFGDISALKVIAEQTEPALPKELKVDVTDTRARDLTREELIAIASGADSTGKGSGKRQSNTVH